MRKLITIEKVVYSFDELKEEVQQRVLREVDKINEFWYFYDGTIAEEMLP